MCFALELHDTILLCLSTVPFVRRDEFLLPYLNDFTKNLTAIPILLENYKPLIRSNYLQKQIIRGVKKIR